MSSGPALVLVKEFPLDSGSNRHNAAPLATSQSRLLEHHPDYEIFMTVRRVLNENIARLHDGSLMKPRERLQPPT